MKFLKEIPVHELKGVAAVSFAGTFLLTGYEFARSPSITLFQSVYGTKNFPLVMSFIPFALVLMIGFYGFLLTRLGARRTLTLTSLFSAAFLMICYGLIQAGYSFMTGPLFVFREAYIVLLIEQYWSFINSTLKLDHAKKLNGPIVGITSFGSIAAGLMVHSLATKLGTVHLLIFAAAFILPAIACSEYAYRLCGEPEKPVKSEKGILHDVGFSTLKNSPMLLMLLFLVILTQVMGTVVQLKFQIHLQESIPSLDEQTAFSGQFYAWINTVSMIFQFIIAPIVLSYFQPVLVQGLIPVIHIILGIFLILHPSLFSAGLAFLMFKAIDYSLFRASKETLYIPLSFDARYRAKEIIDVFGYRFGKGGMSLLITILNKAGFGIEAFYSWISFGASLLWLSTVFPILRKAKHGTRSDIS